MLHLKFDYHCCTNVDELYNMNESNFNLLCPYLFDFHVFSCNDSTQGCLYWCYVCLY